MDQRHLLVIDDEIHIVTILKRRFEAAGWRVTLARDGRQGVEAAVACTPDAVVVDYQMPHMDGLEVAEALFANETTRSAPVLMLTARAHLIDEERLARTNIRDLLSKPFSARELLTRVEKVVGSDTKSGEVEAAA